jgi:hypothetical protein
MVYSITLLSVALNVPARVKVVPFGLVNTRDNPVFPVRLLVTPACAVFNRKGIPVPGA